MKRRLGLVVVMCGTMIVAGCGRQASAPPASSPVRMALHASERDRPYVLTPAVHDFGRIRSDQRAERKTTLTNIGTAPLKIAGIHTSCGCVTASTKFTSLPPGASLDVTVAYVPDGRWGKVHHHADVLFAERGVPPAVIEMKGEVEMVFGRTGGPIDLGEIAASDMTRRTLSIPCRLEPTAGEPTVESTAPHVTATARRERDTVKVSLVVRDAPLGKLEEIVSVQVSPDRGGTATLRVRGHVAAPYKLSAETVFFGFVPCTDTPERRITIDGLREGDVDNVTSTKPGVAARLEFGERGRPAMLVVDLDAKQAGAGMLDGLVTVALRRPRDAALRFRLVGSVLPNPECGC